MPSAPSRSQPARACLALLEKGPHFPQRNSSNRTATNPLAARLEDGELLSPCRTQPEGPEETPSLSPADSQPLDSRAKLCGNTDRSQPVRSGLGAILPLWQQHQRLWRHAVLAGATAPPMAVAKVWPLASRHAFFTADRLRGRYQLFHLPTYAPYLR